MAREHKYVSNSIQSLHRFNITPNAGNVEPLAVMEVILHLWQVSHTHQQAVSHTHTFDSSLCFTRPGKRRFSTSLLGCFILQNGTAKTLLSARCFGDCVSRAQCRSKIRTTKTRPVPQTMHFVFFCLPLFSLFVLLLLPLLLLLLFFVYHTADTLTCTCVCLQLSKDTRFLRCFRLQPWSEDYPALQIADSCCFVPFTSGATTKLMVKPRYWQQHVPHQSHTAP